MVNPIAHWMLEDAVSSDEEMADLLVGLINLSNILLVRQEKLTGLTPDQTLQDILQKYAGIRGWCSQSEPQLDLAQSNGVSIS